MNNAGSMLAVANNSFEQSIALLTAANTTIQNISKASTGLRTIAARIRKTTTGEDDDGEIVEEAKYQEMVNALTKRHVSLVDEVTGQYRSTYDIIRDIASVWKDMTSMEQAAVVEALAGTRQQNIFASLMTQFGEAEEAMRRMDNSAGELQESYDIYLGSIQAHVQTLKAAFDELSRTVVDSEFAKKVVDAGTKIIEIIEKLVSNLGVLGTVITTIGSTILIRALRSGAFVASIKGVGQAIAGVLTTIKTVAPELLLVAAAVAAVTFAVKKLKEANPSTEDLSAAASKAKADAEAAQKAYEDTADAIKENQKRIKALQDLATNGEITEAQKTELEKLLEQNTEYERQITLLERKAELTREAADDAQRESAHAQFNEFMGDGTKKSNSYFGANAWDRVGGDAKVVFGGRVPEYNDAGYNINAAIQMYEYAQAQLSAIQHDMDRYNAEAKEDTAENREKAANLLAAEADAKKNVSETYAQLRSLYLQAAEVREQYSGLAVVDEQSAQDMRVLDYWLDQLDKAMKTDDAEVAKFKRNLEYLDKTVRDKLTKGIQLNEEEQKRFYDWMSRCGYKAEDFGRILQKVNGDAQNLNLPGDDTDGDTIVDKQISRWGTLKDSIESAQKALEDYKNALSAGNSNDLADQMAKAWQTAIEDINNGMENSQAAWAAYNMFIPYAERARMSWDPKQLASYLKSDKYTRIFNEDDGQYDYGQKFLLLLNDMQGALHDVKVEIGDDGSISYRVKDFEDLADQIGYTAAMVNALVVSMNARNNSITNDDAQNEKLIASYEALTEGITNARDAAVAFVKGALEDDPEMLNEDLQRVMDYLHDIGVLRADPMQFDQIIADARTAMQEAKDAADAEADSQEPTKLKAEADEAFAINSTANLLNNIQAMLDNPSNYRVIHFVNDYAGVDFDTGSGSNSGGNSSSSNDSNTKANASTGGVNYPGHAGGKQAGSGGGKTLVNEDGPELISDNGRAFIANNGRPGFVTLTKDAIVFNAEDTEEILRRGSLAGVAQAFANGTGSTSRSGLIGRLLSGRQYPAKRQVQGTQVGGSSTSKPSQHSTSTHTNTTSYTTYSTYSNTAWICPNCGRLCGANASYCYGCGWPDHMQSNLPKTNSNYYPDQYGNVTVTYGDGQEYSYNSGYDYSLQLQIAEAQRAHEQAMAALRAAQEAREKAEREKLNQSNLTNNSNANKSLGSGLAGSGGGNYVGGADYASYAEPQKVDWVAVRINRLQRTIADLEKIATSGFKKLDTRLRYTKDQITNITDELKVQQQAYDRYIQEANSIGLSESIAANVREGTIDITKYDDDTRKKIDEYTEW